MSSLCTASAPSRDLEAEVQRLAGEVDRLGQWQDQHDDRCGERYEATQNSIEDMRKDIGGLRSEIRQLREHLLRPAQTLGALVPPMRERAAKPSRTRLEVTKDVIQIVFQVATGSAVVLWIAGGVFTWLGGVLEHLAAAFPKR